MFVICILVAYGSSTACDTAVDPANKGTIPGMSKREESTRHLHCHLIVIMTLYYHPE